jgi:ketosteroid isomerase-like protein
MCRCVFFDPDDLDAAFAELDDRWLSGEGRPFEIPPLENDAMRACRRWGDALMLSDWAALAALMTPDVRNEDRRLGMSAVQEGPEAVLDQWKVAVSFGIEDSRIELVATRGRKLAIARLSFGFGTGPAPFDVEALALIELDERGLVRLGILFDPDDLDGAFFELEERYIRGEGAPYAETLRLVARLVEATNDRELWSVRPFMSDGSVFVTHKPASLGELGPDEYIESQEALVELLSDFRTQFTRFLALSEECGLAEHLTYGVTTDGSFIEMSAYFVARFRDGLLTRLETFPVEELAAAQKRFDELSSDSS